MLSCDYNGWADVPEDEREAIDVFEASSVQPTSVWVPFVKAGRLVASTTRRKNPVRSASVSRRAAA